MGNSKEFTKRTQKEKISKWLELKKVKKHFEKGKDSEFVLIENDGFSKIKCFISNHEMKASLETLNEFKSSNSYQKLLKRKIDTRQYEPFLDKHTRKENHLFCLLTKKTILCDKDIINKHIEGKKFNIALLAFWNRERKRSRKFISTMQYAHRQIKKLQGQKSKDSAVVEKNRRKLKNVCGQYAANSIKFQNAVSCRKNMKMVMNCKIRLANLKENYHSKR